MGVVPLCGGDGVKICVGPRGFKLLVGEFL